MGIARLIGFSDSRVGYPRTKQLLQFDGRSVRSIENGRAFDIGEFEYVTLEELRTRVEAIKSEESNTDFGTPNHVSHNDPVKEDVQDYMRNPDFNNALFQVASQFNLLEMGHYTMKPEHGVDVYWHDYTQGPACAKATIGATLFRNYFVEHEGKQGQTADRQINGLRDILSHLGIVEDESYQYENGYVRLTKENLRKCSAMIDQLSKEERFNLLGKLSVGIHWECQVNDHERGLNQNVSLILCSGLPLGTYKRDGVLPIDAESLGRLVQDGMQEATILAGALNKIKFGTSKVVLTKLGLKSFGNPIDWVTSATHRALDLVPCSLDVLQFHFSDREPEFDY
jgi:hypothetical protein